MNGDERILLLEVYMAAAIRHVATQIKPQSDALVDRWAIEMAYARRGRRL